MSMWLSGVCNDQTAILNVFIENLRRTNLLKTSVKSNKFEHPSSNLQTFHLNNQEIINFYIYPLVTNFIIIDEH